jgi:hypothetical protein
MGFLRCGVDAKVIGHGRSSLTGFTVDSIGTAGAATWGFPVRRERIGLSCGAGEARIRVAFGFV